MRQIDDSFPVHRYFDIARNIGCFPTESSIHRSIGIFPGKFGILEVFYYICGSRNFCTSLFLLFIRQDESHVSEISSLLVKEMQEFFFIYICQLPLIYPFYNTCSIFRKYISYTIYFQYIPLYFRTDKHSYKEIFPIMFQHGQYVLRFDTVSISESGYWMGYRIR